MKNSNLIWCILLFALLPGCSKDDTAITTKDFTTLYGGRPFKGSAAGIRSQSGRETHRWGGEGRVAVIEVSRDSVSLVFMADFAEVGEVNLKIRGAYQGNGFQATGPSLDFSIVDGKISGNAVNEQQRIVFSGTIAPETSKLDMRIEFLQGQEGFPEGSVLELNLDTSREHGDSSGDGAGCNMRLVPIWSPSGMTMGMVPDC